jgi:ABC-type xylose transport system permease subunit
LGDTVTAAAVFGGTSLFGGVGTAIGTIVGAGDRSDQQMA